MISLLNIIIIIYSHIFELLFFYFIAIPIFIHICATKIIMNTDIRRWCDSDPMEVCEHYRFVLVFYRRFH